MKYQNWKTKAVALLILIVLNSTLSGCQVTVTFGRTQGQALSPLSLSQVLNESQVRQLVQEETKKHLSLRLNESILGSDGPNRAAPIRPNELDFYKLSPGTDPNFRTLETIKTPWIEKPDTLRGLGNHPRFKIIKGLENNSKPEKPRVLMWDGKQWLQLDVIDK